MTTHDLTLLLTIGGILFALGWLVAITVLAIISYIRTGKPIALSPEYVARIKALEENRSQMGVLESGYQTSSSELKAGVDFALQTLRTVVTVYPDPAIKELINFLEDVQVPGVRADTTATTQAVARMANKS